VSGSDEERFLAAVWTLDTLGLEAIETASCHTDYLTYFPRPVDAGEIESILGGRQGAGTKLLTSHLVATSDWQREYRRRSQPFALGGHWWVDPGEPGGRPLDPPEGRRPLRIPARTAFGTGSHLSTSLIVELMEDMRLVGSRVLDVGTGTGILAIVALMSGAESVTALDTDPGAACIAQQTCRLNRVEPRIFAGSIAALRSGRPAGFGVILANILPANLEADLAQVVNHLEPDGSLLMSGLMIEQGDRAQTRLRALGLGTVERRSAGEWLALHLKAEAS
jgi:ribosomal protein L11 methyltransferase